MDPKKEAGRNRNLTAPFLGHRRYSGGADGPVRKGLAYGHQTIVEAFDSVNTSNIINSLKQFPTTCIIP